MLFTFSDVRAKNTKKKDVKKGKQKKLIWEFVSDWDIEKPLTVFLK